MRNVFFTLFTTVILGFNVKAQSPSVELFKQVFEAQMQKLISSGFQKRTISFVQVTPGKAAGGYYPFKVTAYVHDYSAGYPANKYYGQTCLGKMDGWVFNMSKNDFDEWIVQGRFTVTSNECKDNPSEGAEAFPLSAVPGTHYKKMVANNNKPIQAKNNTNNNTASKLYIGEYACYGTGGRLMAGMGFILKSNGTYTDVDNQRSGTYIYDAKNATITFKGGFLSGQVGKNVKQSGFQLSNTVTAEPWK